MISEGEITRNKKSVGDQKISYEVLHPSLSRAEKIKKSKIWGVSIITQKIDSLIRYITVAACLISPLRGRVG